MWGPADDVKNTTKLSRMSRVVCAMLPRRFDYAKNMITGAAKMGGATQGVSSCHGWEIALSMDLV